MAAPGGKFFIQEKLKTPAKHHESFEQLWETKWKRPVRSSLATPNQIYGIAILLDQTH
jgi:hypothetical protein